MEVCEVYEIYHIRLDFISKDNREDLTVGRRCIVDDTRW